MEQDEAKSMVLGIERDGIKDTNGDAKPGADVQFGQSDGLNSFLIWGVWGLIYFDRRGAGESTVRANRMAVGR